VENQSAYDMLVEKWAPVLNAEEAAPIGDYYRKQVTARILENQDRALQEEASMMSGMLMETPHANSVSSAGVANWNPILISLVRRAMPNLIAFDIASVQPMTGPTGLIFAMKSRYSAMDGTEALGLNEPDTDFSGAGIHGGDPSGLVTGAGGATDAGSASSLLGAGSGDTVADDFGYGTGMTTSFGEDLGASGAGTFNEMAFSIEKATVTAKTRALKAEYTMELAQDLKAIHGLDAEAELANMLTTEILGEINREIIRTINIKAKLGCQTANVTTPGTFDLDTDADGRWSVEKFKGLILQLDFEANAISKLTRRGKGNFMVCHSNVASALHAAGMLDYAPDLKTNLNIDDTGNTFAGTLNGKTKVYIDPYAEVEYVNMGYKGTNPYDAGMFYCPYVPLTMVRAVDQDTFQPKIGFKTRYGMVTNPFAEAAPKDDTGANRSNPYFRIFRVKGMLA
jgi:hypothetical protein